MIGQVRFSIRFEPAAFHEVTFQRRRCLLILAGKVVFARRGPDYCQYLERLGMKRLPDRTSELPTPV